jgi:DNA-binding transcriptional LysR family regulator
MELRQLRYFLAVADEGRFSRAARRLLVAAPSLSQQIQALERELHVTLFERTPARITLTPAGEALERRARVIVAEADRAREDARAVPSDGREHLRLRVCNMAELVLDGPLHGAGLGIPGVEVCVASSPGDDAVEAVRQARADAAVVWNRPHDQRDLAGAVLGSVVFGIALPQGHPLTDEAEVRVEDLAGETLLMFPREPFAGIWDRMVEHVLSPEAAAEQVVTEPDLLDAPEALMRAVAAGRGIAAAVLGLSDERRVHGIEIRPLTPPLVLVLEVVWRAPARPAVRRLVDFLRESARDPQAVIEPAPPAGIWTQPSAVTV